MRLGLRLPTYSTFNEFSTLKEYVLDAEEQGVEGFFVIDHLLTARPAYTTSWHDPLITLSFVAATTKKAFIGTMVLVLPLRNVFLLAKHTATLDVFSGGRFILGAGVGWNPDEFKLIDVPLEKRGAIMDEYLVLLKKCWTEEKINFEGKFFNVHNLELLPKPIQKPHPPIWIGGGSQPHTVLYGIEAKGIDKVLLRVAKFADGWIPHSSATPEMVARDWQKIKNNAMEIGRDPYKITRIYSNFIYIKKPGEDDSEAIKRFSIFSGMNAEYWRTYYLFGTVEEVVEKIRKRIKVLEGVDWIVLNPISFERAQLSSIVEDVFDKIVR